MPVIKGIQKTTFIDYPGKIAATVFTGGCNFRCRFCHNSALVKDIAQLPDIPAAELIEYFAGRTKQLDGICISGGEPTIHADLPDFMRQLKGLGYALKLDTNGTNPDMLNKLIEEKLVDYIAMDLKGPIELYPEIANVAVDQEKIQRSIEIILKSGVAHEFRTTMLPCYHQEQNLERMRELVKGADAYYLQQFRPSDNLVDDKFSSAESYSAPELESIAKRFEPLVKKVKVRGIA